MIIYDKKQPLSFSSTIIILYLNILFWHILPIVNRHVIKKNILISHGYKLYN